MTEIEILQDVEHYFTRYKGHKVKITVSKTYEIESIMIGTSDFVPIRPISFSWKDTKEYIDKFTAGKEWKCPNL